MEAYLLWRCGSDAFAWSDAAIERNASLPLPHIWACGRRTTWNDASRPTTRPAATGSATAPRWTTLGAAHRAAIYGTSFLADPVLVYGGRPGKNCGFADWWTLGLVVAPRTDR
jgi:hypothetical protein